MGVRKNAKFLTPAEREDFVKACVLLKAEPLRGDLSPDEVDEAVHTPSHGQSTPLVHPPAGPASRITLSESSPGRPVW